MTVGTMLHGEGKWAHGMENAHTVCVSAYIPIAGVLPEHAALGAAEAVRQAAARDDDAVHAEGTKQRGVKRGEKRGWEGGGKRFWRQRTVRTPWLRFPPPQTRRYLLELRGGQREEGIRGNRNSGVKIEDHKGTAGTRGAGGLGFNK